MQFALKASVLFVFTVVLAFVFQLRSTEALAQSSYFNSRGCVDCHSAPVAATCAGCHQHSGTLTATKNKTTSYSPGETVTITLSASGARSGWIGVRLYDHNGTEIASSTGNQSGMGGSATYPAVLSAPAPATAGTYTWMIGYWGNENGNGSGDVHSGKGVNVSLTVASATAAPTISSVTPNSRAQGTSSQNVTINGTNLTGATLAFSGSGITTGTATISATTITVPVTVAASATTGARTLTVTTAGGSASTTFTVTAAAVPAPTISSVTPNSRAQGTSSQNVTINGTNLTGATLAFSGSGITTGTATISATTITVPVTVAASATTGARTLTVTTAGGSASTTFTVTAAPVSAPTISSVIPTSIAQGTNSTLTINGTNLAGATLAISGTGLITGTATISATTITVPVTVAASAALGIRTVTVTTTGGSSSSAFTVTSTPLAGLTTESITVVDPTTGAINFTVTSDGDVTGASFTGSGVSLSSTTTNYLLNGTNDGFAGSGGMQWSTYLDNPGAGSAVYLRQARGRLATPTDVLAGDRLGAFFFAGWVGGAWRYPASFEANIGTGTISSTSAPGYLTFKTTPDGSVARTERMRIDQDGNVGIGTTAPTQLLDVNSDGIRIRTSKTPASSAAACNQGDMSWDGSYVYVCVATNSWKRAVLASW